MSVRMPGVDDVAKTFGENPAADEPDKDPGKTAEVAEEAEEEPAPEAEETPEGDEDAVAEQLADDEDELEIGPDKHRVKKPVKEAFVGLNKKIQATVEEYKTKAAEIENQRKANDETLRIAATYMKQIGKIQSIDEQLAPYEKLTTAEWIAWAEQDPEGCKKAQTGIFALRMERDKAAKEIEQSENTIRSKAQQETQERKAKAERELAAQIKDWSPAKKEALVKVAKDNGFSDAEVEPFSYDHRVMTILDKARKWDEAQAKAAKIVKQKPAEPPPEPVTKSSGKSPVTDPFSDRRDIRAFQKDFLKARANRRSY